MASLNPNNVDARGSTYNDIRRDQVNIAFHANNPDLNQLLGPINDAAYNHSRRVVKCLHGTREGLIAQIVGWIDRRSGHPICWLNGPAGSGKSAVSHTVAEWCDVKNRLAASFFFLRGAGDRSRISHLIPTLAYQLSISVPATKPLIQRVLQNDRSITLGPLRHQFKKLMIEPILAARNSILAVLALQKPMVIVIDALDECDDKELMAEFIEIITDVCRDYRQFPFRLFFTSRVEEHLRKKLEVSAAAPTIYPLMLQDFDASGDIRKFFQSRFSTIYEENRRLMQSVPLPWPSEMDLKALVEKASGSFIFAFTLINFVNDGGLPHRKLLIALHAHAGLDPLYTQVLSTAPHDHNFERVIGTIMLLTYPLSITSLGHLLHLETTDILQCLLGIQSIIMIPGDDDHPVQLFHTSLRDFLTTKPRSGIFFIDPPTHHIFIMMDCLKVLAMPPENGIFFGGEAQEYACESWCHHFHLALIEGDSSIDSLTGTSLMTCLTNFVSQSLDFWVNTLVVNHQQQWDILFSVQERLAQSGNCPQDLLEVCKHIGHHSKLDEKDFCHECNRRTVRASAAILQMEARYSIERSHPSVPVPSTPVVQPPSRHRNSACLLCQSRPRNGEYDLCGTTCRNAVRNLAPMVLEVPQGHATFTMVENKFQQSWRAGSTPCPRVKNVYRIIVDSASVEAYDDYLWTHGNESFRYHGTERSCALGVNGHTILCTSPTCNACSIIRTSFEVSLSDPGGAFGQGIYTSSASNKSASYSLNSKIMFLTKVVLGNVYTVNEFAEVRSCPPGYQSVVFNRLNGTRNETVVYTNDAIRLVFLIAFE